MESLSINKTKSQDEVNKYLNQISTHTIETTNRILEYCDQVERIGIATANVLTLQDDKLNRMTNCLDKMDSDLNQVENDLKYLKKSSRFLSKCFGFSFFCCGVESRHKKVENFKSFLSKQSPNYKKLKAANIKILINEELDIEAQNRKFDPSLNQSWSNKSIIESFIKKAKLNKNNETSPIPSQNNKLNNQNSTIENDLFSENLKLINSRIENLQLMAMGLGDELNKQGRKIEESAKLTQLTTDKVKKVNKIGTSLLDKKPKQTTNICNKTNQVNKSSSQSTLVRLKPNSLYSKNSNRRTSSSSQASNTTNSIKVEKRSKSINQDMNEKVKKNMKLKLVAEAYFNKRRKNFNT